MTRYLLKYPANFAYHPVVSIGEKLICYVLLPEESDQGTCHTFHYQNLIIPKI
ncbi:MAG TPA: hypothetical protein VMW76_02145 [Bacteroidales bacterium]|nr:hypothetical protein [Bacteroidales bacterium]